MLHDGVEGGQVGLSVSESSTEDRLSASGLGDSLGGPLSLKIDKLVHRWSDSFGAEFAEKLSLKTTSYSNPWTIWRCLIPTVWSTTW